MGLNLSQAAQNLLAQVQSIFGQENVTVTSGKSSRVGVAGGSKTSQHPSGNAFDFHVAGYKPDQVQSILANSGISFGQSIQEYGAAAGTGLNHLGVGTKRQLLTGIDGKYSTTGYASATGAPSYTSGSAILDQVRDYENKFLKMFGFSDPAAKVLTNPDATVGDAIGAALDTNFWFSRISFALLAILLIAVALFMLAGKPAIQIAGKVSPLPA